ncbi:CPBP family intramembrane glutamic endopeptidase [Pseudomonas sp. JDS28PS106]|uniref:CPBP family intramembrane glutamic endopeptidase n=1 Tax=Pseudomonas sp. JDS28PS106 TaxID=2497235 RepID=UPI002FD75A1A
MEAQQKFYLGLLILGYGMALTASALDAAAGVAILTLVLAGLCVRADHAWLRIAGHCLFLITGLGLAAHLLPGFHNAKVIDGARFTADAAPFSMRLNLDKPLLGLWILLACPWLLPGVSWQRCLAVTAVALVATATLCMGLAVLLDIVRWAPKWPEQGLLWAANNLLLVSLTEELLFRAYLQGLFERWCKPLAWGPVLAVAASASLFGLAHVGGGWHMVLLAGIAGIGYGIAFRLGGLGASVLCHFGLNLLHFGLFTYPMLE